jgi:ankyrin repeat protein
LHVAVEFGSYPVADLLLKNNADPNFRNVYGNTPLHTACKNNSLDIILLLKNYGASFDIFNNGLLKPHAYTNSKVYEYLCEYYIRRMKIIIAGHVLSRWGKRRLVWKWLFE